MSQSLTTPARLRFSRSANGLIYVGDTAIAYADGSENRMLKLLQSCTDLGSMSTEMLDKAIDWAERYHSHPARANVIRAIGIPPESSILEVGAGCGGVTRYLGEQGLIVDALEPMEDRAIVARERTRDLPGVEVLVGEVFDLPAEPTYDLVVVVGVLEYVGLGSANHAPYVNFLSHIRSLLKGGGSIILAIENQLGVKYLAGAPEDHTSQVFDSIEGYPRGERARTFSRSELLNLMREAGLVGETFAAFPDYKLTEAVLSPHRFPHNTLALLADIPTFPSPDWVRARPRLASERLVWREFVRAGLAEEVPNSFVVLAGKGEASDLWPAERIGKVYSDNTAAPFALETTLLIRGEQLDIVEFEHRSLPEVNKSSAVAPSLGSHPFIDGLKFSEAFAYAAPDERVRLAGSWNELILLEAQQNGCSLHSTVFVRPDGSLSISSGPLRIHGIDASQTLMRGVLWEGLATAAVAPPSFWPGATTARDVVEHFGSLLHLNEDPGWLDNTVKLEAEVQSEVSIKYPSHTAQVSWLKELENLLSRELGTMELGPRSFDRELKLESEVEALRVALEDSQRLLKDAQGEVARYSFVSKIRQVWRR